MFISLNFLYMSTNQNRKFLAYRSIELYSKALNLYVLYDFNEVLR